MFKKICSPWLASLMLAALFLVSLPVYAANSVSLVAGENLTEGVRVKISGTGVVIAGATDIDFGVSIAAATSGAPATINTYALGDVGNYIAAGAITAGADVYPAASGKVSATVSGTRIGIAVRAVASNNDIVKVLRLHSAPDRVFISVPIAAASVDSWAFVADRAYTVVGIRETHSVAGSDGGTVTLDLRKVTDATAPGAAAGSTVKEFLSAALNLKSTINTPVAGTLTATGADLDLAAGDKIGLNFVGTLTALAGGVVQIELRVK